MKGRTIIELIDEKTGEKEVIADHNMIGPAVQELLNAYEKHPFNRELPMQINPAWSTMFGGVLLFTDQINEAETGVPAGNMIIGAGSYQYSDINSTVTGTYNIQESEKTDGYVRHVWDFSTSQANGRISSICLCDAAYTKQMLFGCDYSSSNTGSTSVKMFDYEKPTMHLGISAYGSTAFISSSTEYGTGVGIGNSGRSYSTYSPHWIFLENDLNYYVTIEVTDYTTLTLKRWKINKNSLNIFGSIGHRIAAYSSSTDNGYHSLSGGGFPAIEIESRSFTVGTLQNKYIGSWYDQRKKKFYFGSATFYTIANNASCEVLEFDFSAGESLSTVSMDLLNFTNKTGSQINFLSETIVSEIKLYPLRFLNPYFAVENGYYIVVSNGQYYKIKVDDTSEIIPIQAPLSVTAHKYFYSSFNGILYTSGTDSIARNVIDTVANTVKQTKELYYNVTFTTPTKTKSVFVAQNTVSSLQSTRGTFYPTSLLSTRNYLSTINNLAQPVVKTNDKSMKVTYILEVDNE